MGKVADKADGVEPVVGGAAGAGDVDVEVGLDKGAELE